MMTLCGTLYIGVLLYPDVRDKSAITNERKVLSSETSAEQLSRADWSDPRSSLFSWKPFRAEHMKPWDTMNLMPVRVPAKLHSRPQELGRYYTFSSTFEWRLRHQKVCIRHHKVCTTCTISSFNKGSCSYFVIDLIHALFARSLSGIARFEETKFLWDLSLSVFTKLTTWPSTQKVRSTLNSVVFVKNDSCILPFSSIPIIFVKSKLSICHKWCLLNRFTQDVEISTKCSLSVLVNVLSLVHFNGSKPYHFICIRKRVPLIGNDYFDRFKALMKMNPNGLTISSFYQIPNQNTCLLNRYFSSLIYHPHVIVVSKLLLTELYRRYFVNCVLVNYQKLKSY